MVTRALLAVIAWALACAAAAHGGGLDQQGCHHDRKRGGYHCHRAITTPLPPPSQQPKRSSTERSTFQSRMPCPSTGARRGPCPGYVVDHIQALKRGGFDHWSNMQWQTRDDARRKDRWE